MANRLERVPELTVIPGTPAQPEVPERCVSVRVGTRSVAKQVTEQQIQSPTFSEYTTIDPVNVDGTSAIDFNTTQQIHTPAPGGQFSGSGGTKTYTIYVREPVYERYCTGGQPFVPGTPAQVIEDAGPDWLSYARSQPVVPTSGGFTLDLVGPAMVGLSEPVLDGSYSLGVLDYGIYYDGAAVYPVIGGSVGASLGAYSGTLAVKLDRQLGVYRAYIAGTEVHSANLPQSADAALVAFLETDEGYVDNPEKFSYAAEQGQAEGQLAISTSATPSLAVTPMGGFSQTAYCGALVDGRLDVIAEGRLPQTPDVTPNVSTPTEQSTVLGQTAAITGSADGGQIRGTAMTMFASDAPYTAVELAIPKQELTASSVGSAGNVALTRVAMAASKPQLNAYVITGGVITSGLEIPKQSMAATEGPFAQITGDMPRNIMTAYVTTGEVLAAAYTERVAVFEQSTPSLVAVLAITLGDLTVSEDVSFSLAVTEQLDALLTLSDDYTLTRALQTLVDSQVRIEASARAPDQVDTQYLVTELTGALSRSIGMQFDQFVYTNGRTYGVRSDGLYLIGPQTEELDAEVDFGATTFGTSRAKNIEFAFIGMTTDGTVYFVADSDGKEKVYKAIQREPTMKVKTGRGITARKWNLKLKVMDATAAEIEDLELVIGVSRRWTR